MSKSILVIDAPDACIDCPCHYTYDDDYWCGVNGKEFLTEDIESYKADWCPLKEVPQKYEPVGMNFEIGWNACIDEILKGSEG